MTLFVAVVYCNKSTFLISFKFTDFQKVYLFTAQFRARLCTPDGDLELNSLRDAYMYASADRLKPCPHCRKKVRLSHKSETVSQK